MLLCGCLENPLLTPYNMYTGCSSSRVHKKGENAVTERAKELLIKLASAYDNNKKNDFDTTFYIGFPDAVIGELVNDGCVVKQNDIVGTIKLTEFGYAKAKR